MTTKDDNKSVLQSGKFQLRSGFDEESKTDYKDTGIIDAYSNNNLKESLTGEEGETKTLSEEGETED
jgi:hypothetical protein